ncbi:MAG: hypothetical protein QN148_04075, partial [Armatimonadota bacterium]|nr:hypothetical protein [Armatimonadota bacterium]
MPAPSSVRSTGTGSWRSWCASTWRSGSGRLSRARRVPLEAVTCRGEPVAELLVVRGGRRLEGAVKVAGAVNTVLPIMAAAALAADVSVIENVPRCRDVQVMAD